MRRIESQPTHAFRSGDRVIAHSRRNGVYSGVVTSTTMKGVRVYPDYPIRSNHNQIDRHITLSMAQNVILETRIPEPSSPNVRARRQGEQPPMDNVHTTHGSAAANRHGATRSGGYGRQITTHIHAPTDCGGCWYAAAQSVQQAACSIL